jgi:hypothetical protein
VSVVGRATMPDDRRQYCSGSDTVARRDPRVGVSGSKKKLGSDYHVREGVMPQKSMISYMHNVLHI